MACFLGSSHITHLHQLSQVGTAWRWTNQHKVPVGSHFDSIDHMLMKLLVKRASFLIPGTDLLFYHTVVLIEFFNHSYKSQLILIDFGNRYWFKKKAWPEFCCDGVGVV